MHPTEDPFYQIGAQQQQQRVDRSFQRLQNMAEQERQIHNRFFHFLTSGVVRLLRIHSPTSLYLFVVPFWLFVGAVFAFDIGHTILQQNANATSPEVTHVAYGIGAVCLLAMFISMMVASYRAMGLNRIIASLHLIVAIPFVGLVCQHYLNPNHSTLRHLPSNMIWEAVLTMVGFFAVVLVHDLIQSRRHHLREME